MKCIILAFLSVMLVVLVQGQGIPMKSCPPGEHSVLYCPPKAEPTCETPYLHEPQTPKPCDVPECFCNTSTIRNTRTGKCVRPSNCPK